jgi:hypothetical protein
MTTQTREQPNMPESGVANGGPAFPHEYKYSDGTAERAVGMTLRDYFAAAALPVASVQVERAIAAGGTFGKVSLEQILAEASYAIADAMLKERVPQP